MAFTTFVGAAAYTVYLAVVITTATPLVLGGYIVASILALAAWQFDKRFASLSKWIWIALSLTVIFAVVTGPLNYLQLN